MQQGFSSKGSLDFSNIKIHSLSPAREYFLKYFEANMKEEFSSEALSLYKEVKKLKTKDFYELMKQLIRVSSDIDKLRDAMYKLAENYNLANVTGLVSSIFVKNYKGQQDISKKIQSIIFISRLAFPLGINMKNPNMDKINSDNIDKFSFPVNEYLTIALPSKHKNPIKIIVNPGEDTTTINTNNSHSKESEISNGEGVLIGRPMEAGTILGHNLSDITIKSHLCFNHSRQDEKDYNEQYVTFSRAGILLVRLNDRLFFFNRGSTNSVQIKSLRKNKAIFFSPDTVTFNNNKLVA